MDVALAAVELRGDGVDEERHVVVDDLDDGVLEGPPVGLDGGVEEADLRRTRFALLAKLPERQRSTEERVEGAVDDVVGRDEGEIAPDEVLHALGLVRPQAVARLGDEAIHEVGFTVFGCQSHARANHIGGPYRRPGAAATERGGQAPSPVPPKVHLHLVF